MKRFSIERIFFISFIVIAILATLAWAGTFTSYDDETNFAKDDQLLFYDPSEGSGDYLSNITISDAFGKIHPIPTEISGNTSLNTDDVRGRFYLVTAACTITLDAAADVGYGSVVGFYVRDAAEQVIIEIDGSDKINLHGTPLDAGDVIDSPLNAGDLIFLLCYSDVDGSGTDGWITLGYGEAVWTDGGAS